MTTITLNQVETFRQINNTYVFFIHNSSLELKNASGLYKQILTLLADESVEKIVLNLKNVVSMNTSGIGALLSVYHACTRSDVEFVICNLTTDIDDLLHTTQVLNVLTVVENEQMALED